MNAKQASPKPSKDPSPERSRDLLLQAAKKLFARKGYDATTVREIAHEAGLNLSLVSYYFEGKEGLYREIIDGFGRDRMSAMQRILQEAKTAEEMRLRLQLLFEEMVIVSLKEKDVTTILFREMDHDLPVAQQVFEETFHKMFDRMIDFFRNGQTLGYIDSSLDPQLLAQISHGFIVHLLRTDGLCKRFQNLSIQDEAFRKKAIETFLQIFTKGCLNGSTPPIGGYL